MVNTGQTTAGKSLYKIILAPDSFKGTLSAPEVCEIMEECVLRRWPDAKVVSIPMADGGEGTVDCFLRALGGERRTARAEGPYFEPMQVSYALLDQGKTAVVEMACCAGLPLVEERKDPEKTTTFGVGRLLAEAAQKGVKKIILGMGGSATNDGGCGAAAGAGVRFLDGQGRAFVPTGGTLCDICRIDLSGLEPALRRVEILGMCDIDNPLYGAGGAAAVFAPQKGADAAMVERLDAGLRHLNRLWKEQLGFDAAALPGGGAAGGMGGGLAAFFGAGLTPGIDIMLDAAAFDRQAADADLIFTGEGRLDAQSLRGKVIAGVSGRAMRLGVPVIAVVGDLEDGIEAIYERGLRAAFSINRKAVPFSEARKHTRQNLTCTMDNIIRTLSLDFGGGDNRCS